MREGKVSKVREGTDKGKARQGNKNTGCDGVTECDGVTGYDGV